MSSVCNNVSVLCLQVPAESRHGASRPAEPSPTTGGRWQHPRWVFADAGGLQQRLRGPEPDGVRIARCPRRPPDVPICPVHLRHVLAGRRPPGRKRDLGDGQAGAEGTGLQRRVHPRPRDPLRGAGPDAGLGWP